MLILSTPLIDIVSVPGFTWINLIAGMVAQLWSCVVDVPTDDTSAVPDTFIRAVRAPEDPLRTTPNAITTPFETIVIFVVADPLESFCDAVIKAGNDAESTFCALTAPSCIAAVVTELAGNGAFNKSPLVIFFVVDDDVSTIAISSELSAVVKDGSWDTRGKVILLLSNYWCV